MALIKNKNLKTIIIVAVVFVVWFSLSVYITLSRNKNWFEPRESAVEPAIEREDLVTTDKKEFFYATAWSKAENNWVLSNIDGYAELVIDENYTEVTNFGNTGYSIVKDKYGNKTVLDRTGKPKLYDNCYVCDKIITDDFNANMIVASKTITEDGEEKIGYGIIDATLSWAKAPSSKNDYLVEFTKGIDGTVFTNDTFDKLYFYTLDKIVEDVDEFLYYDTQTAMYRKGTTVYLIDKSGEHERVDFENVAKIGEWADETIYCEFSDGRKGFVDINGEMVLDLTAFNVINSPRMILGYAGILMRTDEGTKYTVIDKTGNFMFEPRLGDMCDTLTEKFFRVSYFDAEQNRNILGVINESGNLSFEYESSITYFNNGYAIKDGKFYVRTDGTELQIFKYK